MSDHVCLLCKIQAASPEKRDRVISLLNNAKSYYESPRAKCTTWSYFKPSTRPKAPSQMVSKENRDSLVAGMEIYTAKSALSEQMEEQWFKDFQTTLKNEKLVSDEERLVAWYVTAGFVARGETAKPFGNGVIVCTAKFTCKDGQREEMVKNLSKYTEWVKENEPGVLTYGVMTRPKAPNEVLLFERYQDLKAFGSHGSTKEFKAMFKSIAPHIEVKATLLQEWNELDSAFVGNVIGGQEGKSKL